MNKTIQALIHISNGGKFMDFTALLTIIACICFIFIIGKVFIIPLKVIFKLILNSILGGILIFLINIFAQSFNFHIGLNLLTAIFVGLLGIPRCHYFNIYSIIFTLKKYPTKGYL